MPSTSKHAVDLPISREILEDFKRTNESITEAFKKFANLLAKDLPPDLLDQVAADLAYEEACQEWEEQKHPRQWITVGNKGPEAFIPYVNLLPPDVLA